MKNDETLIKELRAYVAWFEDRFDYSDISQASEREIAMYLAARLYLS
jgi:hypothetical protein